MMGDVTEESLLNYFFSAGGNSGRVKNADMLKTFKPFIGHSDPQLRAKYREEFKLIIDRIAVVKSENGEKYLVLKKKYRNLLQERDTRHHETDGNAQRNQSLARVTAAAQWEATDILTSSPSKKEEQDEPMSCGDPDEESESEHDEESTGSMGSASVALDPTEKEWIYHAASARVPDLSQLLMQEPSLANKKDFTSVITALHWAAKHGNENMAVLMADAGADVNTKSHGGYTPLHIAALHGHRHILDLLIGTYGAKENVRDYSGRLPGHYLNIKDPEGPQEDCDLQFQVAQARERNKNRKLVSLFHSKKKWGSAEELAPIEEERTATHQLALPPFRPRKFSR
ncbi:ankyrin repeat domain-containing protein SOWAHA isoform X5 [Poecilia latipinna]|uniref:ankyrin repeat domain-containing protein SOWAHA isoform X5 n=1 Tax=Poecilia latipinna TaxID=48699 RepID=UPI00072E74C5|nr:PREDICTED: ankyrin repeat domain-containing protein SOWAHA-like isoform X5 [Poecilia latipinna]XP_016536556.1 PREDICTED: ankyrin repeat domain-containing protein SOWAHA-like isoform X5 [Poecilia formosa]